MGVSVGVDCALWLSGWEAARRSGNASGAGRKLELAAVEVQDAGVCAGQGEGVCVGTMWLRALPQHRRICALPQRKEGGLGVEAEVEGSGGPWDWGWG